MNARIPLGRSIPLLLVVAVSATACQAAPVDVGEAPSSTTLAPPTTLPPATSLTDAVDWHAYVEHALALLENQYYQPDQVDWENVRARAWEVLGDKPNQDRAHQAIKLAIQEMMVPHTFLLTPEAVETFQLVFGDLPPTGGVVAERIGLLDLPGTTGSGDVGKYYASTLHDLARAAAAAEVCGWVIDLRDNGGGSMFPMLAGLRPFLGGGVFLTMRHPAGGTEHAYSFEDGQLLIDGAPPGLPADVAGTGMSPEEIEHLTASAQLYTEPFVLSDTSQPIAVLTSFRTASSGEIVIIAFKGRDGTRFFGEPSAGVPTSNELFRLEDGAWLFITTAELVDRNGQLYEGSIQPDEIVIPLPQTEADEVLDRAVQWILSQPACDT